jgi:signal transduction histidine kinase
MQRQIFGGMVGVGLLCAVLAGTALHSLGYAPPRDHPRDPLRAAVVWGCVAAGLGLGSHWMARRLTRRLVALQRKVEAWGQGDLSARVCLRGDDEIARLGHAWNDAAARVEALLEARAQTLAHASHELRSPLARLRLALAFAEEGRPLPAEALAEALRDVAELDALIEDLLLSGRLAGSPLRAEPVELLALAVVEAERVGAEVIGAETWAWGDRRLLVSLLRNLLENARRHGLGAPITVEIGGQAQGVWLTVSDRGPGVPDADKKRIFEPYYRGPGQAESEGGVGLGLALVAQIAQHHGGDVRCEDRPGGGTRFCVCLRRPPEQGAAIPG